MRPLPFVLPLICLCLAPCATARDLAADGYSRTPSSGPKRFAAAYAALPLSFEQNIGQADSAVAYVARGQGYSLLVQAKGVTLVLGRGRSKATRGPGLNRVAPALSGTASETLTLELDKGDPAAEGFQEGLLPGKSNYFLGADPSRWIRDVPLYGSVGFHGVRPGVDLKYYGTQGRLEYDFVVHPGAEVQGLAWTVRGAKSLSVDAAGGLVLGASAGAIRFGKPKCRLASGKASAVEADYVLDGPARVRVAVRGYHGQGTLVIDPVLNYSTYLGGGGIEFPYGIAVDAQGEALVAGSTSGGIPSSPGAYQTAFNGASEAFVTKLDAAGDAVVYSTYLGGGGQAQANGIAADPAGDAFVVGTTNAGFPVTYGAYQTTVSGTLGPLDYGFVAELNAAGDALVYSTYVGGSEWAEPLGVALDASGCAYVDGATATGFPVSSGAFQTSVSAPCGFVLKMNAAGSGLDYASLFGGNDTVVANAVAVDGAGSAYLTGIAYNSAGIPVTSGAYQTVSGGDNDAFIAKVNPSGSGLAYCTYLGGTGNDWADSIAVDASGDAYVTGLTGGGFPVTQGAYETSFLGAQGSGECFVAELNPRGSSLVYSTYLSKGAPDQGFGIAADAGGAAYVTGQTSDGFPTTSDALEAADSLGGLIGFFCILSPGGSGLEYSTYLGEGNWEEGDGVALDGKGSIYLCGATGAGFPTTSAAYEPDFEGGSNSFVLVFGSAVWTPTASPTPQVSFSPSPPPSQTPSVSPTASPTATATPTPTPTPSWTFSPTASPSLTVTPSWTASPTPSATSTSSPSPTDSPSSTATPSSSATPTSTVSLTVSPTATPTPTSSPTLSATLSWTDSPTVSATPSATVTATQSPTFSVSPTVSRSPSPAQFGQDVLLAKGGLYPNPFSSQLNIYFTLKVPAVVTFAFYNVAGEPVCSASSACGLGPTVLAWQGLNNAGAQCASGVYLLKVSAQGSDGSRGSYWDRAVLLR